MSHRILAHNATDAWTRMMRLVHGYGKGVEVRGMMTKEVLNVSLEVSSPVCNLVDHPAKRMPHRFSIAEMIWILTGQNRVDMIDPYNSAYKMYSDDGVHMFGAYGPVLVEQLPWAIDQLRYDKYTRQAVITIWRPRPKSGKDIPCTTTFQFLVRDDRLHMISTMRSNDIVRGLPTDMYVFTSIQRYVAQALQYPPGTWTHNVASSHIYDQHFDLAREVAESRYDSRGEGEIVTPCPAFPWPHAALVGLVGGEWDTEINQYMYDGWRSLLMALEGSSEDETNFEALVGRGLQPITREGI